MFSRHESIPDLWLYMCINGAQLRRERTREVKSNRSIFRGVAVRGGTEIDEP